jgi:hypothetical protein
MSYGTEADRVSGWSRGSDRIGISDGGLARVKARADPPYEADSAILSFRDVVHCMVSRSGEALGLASASAFRVAH